MKYPIFLLLIVLICACVSKKSTPRAERIRYWYTTNFRPIPRDTFSFWQLKFDLPRPTDSLLASDLIEINDTGYYVMVYTNEFDCPIDGDARTIYVDGFGKVYQHALTWRNFGVLQTNNDSINRLISLFVAKGLQISTERELRSKEPFNPEREKIFLKVPPNMK